MNRIFSISRACPKIRPELRLFRNCGFAAVAALLFVTGCAGGLAPDDIPDVPPLDFTVAEEVPAGTIDLVPEVYVPPPVTAHDPVLPSAVVPIPGQPAQIAAAPRTPEEQRIASLELTLLNMSNELAWLRSQPSSPTTPWGTPSPRVVPAPGDPAQPAPSPAALSGSAQERADRAQARIVSLERNIELIQDEIAQLRGQAAGVSQPGMPPDVERLLAEDASPATPMTSRRPTVTVGELPQRPLPPPPPQEALPVASVPEPQPIDPATMTPYPVTAPLAEVAARTIPPPSPEAVATPPLHARSGRSGSGPVSPTASSAAPATRPQALAPAPTVPAGSASPPVPTAAPTLTPAQPSVHTPPQASAPQRSPQPAAQPQQARTAPAPQGEQSAYQQALNAYEVKRYNEAYNGFDRYLEAYPNGRYAANAVYWKGEVRYALGDYAGAIMLFRDVVGRFPQHAKAADALLKIVMSYNNLGDRDNGALYLRILREDYPRSDAARRAQRMGLS